MSNIVFVRFALPEVTTGNNGYDWVRAGEWTFDPREEDDSTKAWENAKAWAAYALWLETK